MPVTFNLFRVRKFPKRPTAAESVVFQQGDRELRGTPAQTKVWFRSTDREHGLEMYVSEHETLKRVEGRLYTGEEFHEFFKKNQVLLVLDRKRNLLICKSSGTVARDFIDEWNDSNPSRFRADYLHFDLESLQTRIGQIRGIWRSGLNQPNVETFAVFGPDVDQSSLYNALSELGVTASMLITQVVNGNSLPAIVSAKGSVTFPQPAAEEQQVDRLLGVYEQLLQYGLKEVESRKTAQERKAREREATKAARTRPKTK